MLPLIPLLLVPLLHTTTTFAQTTMHYADMTPPEKLMAAAKEGNIHGIRESIASGVNIDLKSSDFGMTALHYIANGGYVNCVDELVDNGGANMNLQDNWGQTPLMLAATRLASVEVAKALIDHGADIEMVDAQGRTALMWATQHRNEKVVRKLLSNKANLMVRAGKCPPPIDPHPHVFLAVSVSSIDH